jgi:hypothetical protein
MTDEKDAAAHALIEMYADALELTHGPCLAGRAALMAWLDDQFLRLAKLDVPDDRLLQPLPRLWIRSPRDAPSTCRAFRPRWPPAKLPHC